MTARIWPEQPEPLPLPFLAEIRESHIPGLPERIERNAEVQVSEASDGSIAMALKVAPLEGG